ncbi:MAG: Fe-S-containing hydro-lyase [Clostridia bacterium]|nr:Fe-S-containing hydro-lyase [Clostridia bacterium]
MAEKYLKAPLTDQDVSELTIGDQVYISGIIYTARDAAHKRLVELLDKGEELPLELEGQILFYVGPSPAKPGAVIGSAGPTTSYRMDAYTPALLDKGLKGMIGKGSRSQEVKESIVKNKAVYFAAVGGAAALTAQRIKKAEVIAYPDLGPEAIHKLEVENLPVIVVNDSFGRDLYQEGMKKYQS